MDAIVRGNGATHRARPTIKLLDRRNARGSSGSLIRPHSCTRSAPRTSRLGSFLKLDLAPRVAASLYGYASRRVKAENIWGKRRVNRGVPEETEATVAPGQDVGIEEHGGRGAKQTEKLGEQVDSEDEGRKGKLGKQPVEKKATRRRGGSRSRAWRELPSKHTSKFPIQHVLILFGSPQG